jgi:hypothetical protein
LFGRFSTLKTEVIHSSETSVYKRTTRCYIPEMATVINTAIRISNATYLLLLLTFSFPYLSLLFMTCFGGAVNRNIFYFLILLFHITTCFGLYGPSSGEICTVGFRSYYAYNWSVFRLYSLLFHIKLCNIL